MSFNKYSVYSTLSQTESSNNKEYEECIKLIESLDEISTRDSAKLFLQKTWNYTEFSQKRSITKDFTLHAKEDKHFLVITFDSAKEHYIYTYNK